MSGISSIAGAEWLAQSDLRRLIMALGRDGEEARIAGGAVRNALLGLPVTDVDIATTTLPDETVRRTEAEGFRTVPTGIEHGTVTVIAGGKPYEVTTLRDDVETDGRRARVCFGRDWTRDAERRDFTMNALYATIDGEIVDLVGGVADIEGGTVRFIGDAEQRIREDYLRILRFFRIFAWYGRGRPDADGLKACARLKQGIGRLSAERIWQELRKLLSAPDPSRALLWMRQASVLTQALPETEKWGIDSIHAAISAERDYGWPVDPVWRLAGMMPPDPERVAAMAERLKLSRADADRLAAWAREPAVAPDASRMALRKRLHATGKGSLRDRLRLDLAVARQGALADDAMLVKSAGLTRLLELLETTEMPDLPVNGDDLIAAGVPQGRKVGELLDRLATEWIESGFALDRKALLERMRQLAGHTY